MKRILILLLALCSLKTMAQYPVSNISITLPPQPKPNIGDWAMPFVISAQARLVQGQVPGNLVESRILVTIKKNGSKFCGNYTQQNAPYSQFSTATKTWTAGAAIGLISTNCEMPPGNYELCVQFFGQGAVPGQHVALSNEVCKPFTIADNRQITFSPPQNIVPVDGKAFTEQEAMMPVMFRWTPVIPKPKEDVIYKVRIVEILKGQSKSEALKTNAPLNIIEVKNATQTSYKLAPRCHGCGLEAVWNVEAVGVERGQGGEPKNYGKSEATELGLNNEIKYTTPQNVLPSDGRIFTKEEAAKPLLFKWTPVVPKPKSDVVYKVRVIEMLKGQSKSAALKTNTPIEVLEVKNETQVTSKLSKRCNNCEYVWNVEASKKSQLGDIEMLGTSDGSSFRINASPSNTLTVCDDVTVSNINIDCQAFPTYLIHDKITNNSGKNIVSWTLTSASGNFNNAGPQSIAKNSSVNTQAIGLTNAIPDVNRYVFGTYTFTFDDNSTCTNSVDYLLPDCNPACACGQWSNVRFSIPSLTGGATTYVTASCGGNDTVIISPNAIFTMAPAYNCTGNNCVVSYKYDVFYKNGTALYNNVNASVIDPQEMNNCGEVYKIVIKPTCNGQSCQPCTVYLKRNCPQACQCVNAPTVVKSTVINGVLTEIPFSCTAAAPYINRLKCNANDTIIVRNFCTGSCNPSSATLTIKKPDGSFVTPITHSSMPNEEWYVIPASNQSGIYQFEIHTACGSTPMCTNCKIDFQQNCPQNCTCGSWSNVVFRAEIIPGILTNISKQCLDTIALPKDVNFTINPIYNCTGNNCNASYLYDVFLSGGTQIYSNVTAAQINTAQLNSCGEVYRIVIKPTCSGQSCTPCTVYLKRICVPSCTCGTWADTKATYTVLGTLQKDDPISCGKGVTVDCNKPVTISWNFNCIGQCAAATTVAVYPPSGGRPIGMAGGSSITFTPTILTGGPYKVVLKGTCGNNACDSCVIYVTPKCAPLCNCGKWGPVVVGGEKKKCGGKVNWQCKVPLSFSNQYYCSPANDTACKADIRWEIKNGGVLINSGSGIGTITGGFTPAANGTYLLTMYASCDGKVCDSCTYTIEVSSCNTCECKGWGPVKYTNYKNGTEQPWQSIICGNKQPITAEMGQPYRFISQLNCNTQDCKSENNRITVYNAAGNIIYSAAGNILTDYVFKECGKYRIVFSGSCGNNKCEDCILNIEVPCCKCKDEPTITLTEGDGKPKKIKCGAQKYIKIECNKKYTLSALANCSGDECKGTTFISINGPGINLVNVASTVTFTPTQTGYITATIKSVCGTDSCQPCIITFVDTCICKTCDTKEIVLKRSTTPLVIKSNSTSGYDLLSLGFDLTTGPLNITEVKAELVAFDMVTGKECKTPNNKTEVAQGQFNQPGCSLATLFTDWQYPNPASGNYREIKWVSTNAAGVNMAGGKALKLQVGIPDFIVSDCCQPSFKFCIRVSVRDINCAVCDKLFCVELKAGEYKIKE